MQTAVFTSDVHLSRHHPAGMERWGRFLDGLGGRARSGEAVELFILGDLFEFWQEFLGMPHRGYRPVLEAIRRTVDAGCPVKVLVGNRDFLFGKGMAASGAEHVGNVFEGSLLGRRVYVSHGDELCTRDRRYQVFRRLVRCLPMRLLMALTPRTLAFAAADLAQLVSGYEKRAKGLEMLDIQAEAAEAVAARGFDLVICGHVHLKRRDALSAGGGASELITLPAWHDDEPVEVLELTEAGAAFVAPFGAEEGHG